MIVDTSAVLAILLDEPERADFAVAITASPVRLMSAANALEAWIRSDSISPVKGAALDELFELLDVQMQPVTIHQARLAREAYRRFGKGRHPAGLNYGDCFAYALAKATSLPLLFKGEDFSQTDLKAAL